MPALPGAQGKNPTKHDGTIATPTTAPQGPQVQTPVAQPQAAGAGVQAQGVGTGFLNLQNVLAANAPAARNMAQGLLNNANKLGGAANKAITGIGKPSATAEEAEAKFSGGIDSANDAQAYANGLNSLGGLQAALQKQYQSGAYTPGQSTLDAFLAGQAGGPAFQQAASNYQGLVDKLMNKASERIKRPGPDLPDKEDYIGIKHKKPKMGPNGKPERNF